MLTELHIENLGVIERLELILGDGLTVVTGETGAGKTMLVEAIELLVGGRADTTVVRHGTDEARVDGRFITAAGDELVLSRVDRPQREVTRLRERPARDGRVAGRGDGGARRPPRPARPPEPAVDRDATGRTRPVRPTSTSNRCVRRGARLTEIDAELAALGGDERVRAREIDLLRYQLDELDRADVTDADEDARLDAEETLLGDAVGFREAGEQAVAALADDGGARDALATRARRARRASAVRRDRRAVARRTERGRRRRRRGTPNRRVDRRVARTARSDPRASTAAQEPVPQVRRRPRRGDGVPRRDAGPPRRAGAVRCPRRSARRRAATGARRRARRGESGRQGAASSGAEVGGGGAVGAARAGAAARRDRRAGRRPRRRRPRRPRLVPARRQPRFAVAPAHPGGVRWRARPHDARAAAHAHAAERRRA